VPAEERTRFTSTLSKIGNWNGKTEKYLRQCLSSVFPVTVTVISPDYVTPKTSVM